MQCRAAHAACGRRGQQIRGIVLLSRNSGLVELTRITSVDFAGDIDQCKKRREKEGKKGECKRRKLDIYWENCKIPVARRNLLYEAYL